MFFKRFLIFTFQALTRTNEKTLQFSTRTGTDRTTQRASFSLHHIWPRSISTRLRAFPDAFRAIVLAS